MQILTITPNVDPGCGCVGEEITGYDPLTVALMDSYASAGYPLPTQVKIGFDNMIKGLKAAGLNAMTFARFTKTAGVSVYNIPGLKDAVKVMAVTVEGQGINESDPNVIEIDITTGDVRLKQDYPEGSLIKIDYSK